MSVSAKRHLFIVKKDELRIKIHAHPASNGKIVGNRVKESISSMFAAILRRWRLVTPLVLAVLAISIVSGGMMMPASAHNIKFHFFGRAYALNDNQPIPDTACDTGYLPLTGQHDLDTGHCFGAAGPGEPGAAVTGGVTGNPGAPGSVFGRMYTIFADDSVVSTHGNTSGKVVSTADLEGGINVCLFQAACEALLTTDGNNSISRGCQFATFNENEQNAKFGGILRK